MNFTFPLRIAAFLLLACPACIGTETGNPPLQPDLNESLLTATEDGANARIVGMPGAVSPGGVELQLTELGSRAAPLRMLVGDDGSFELVQPLFSRGRLQAINGRLRSDTVDVSLTIDVATGDCRPVIPESYYRLEGPLGEERGFTFRVRSPCGETLTPSMRLGDQGLSVSGAVVADGGLDVTVVFDGREGEVEDVVRIGSPRSEQFITIVAESCGDDCTP